MHVASGLEPNWGALPEDLLFLLTELEAGVGGWYRVRAGQSVVRFVAGAQSQYCIPSPSRSRAAFAALDFESSQLAISSVVDFATDSATRYDLRTSSLCFPAWS